MAGLSLATLIAEVYSNTGTDSDDISQADVTSYLNRSYNEVTKKLNFRQEDGEFTIAMTSGVRSYQISNYISDFDAVRHVTILNTVNSPYQWEEVVQTDYDNLMNDYDTSPYNQTFPTRYARFGDKIVFDATPVANYQVTVRYRKALGDIDTAGPGIPSEWHEAVLYGAIGRIWLRLGYPPRANQALSMQAQLISTMVETETKEERDYSLSGGKTLRARYP